MNDPAARPEVWIVRHGETEWSKAWKHTSHTDLPLTAAGEQQAAALRPALAEVGFDTVLTSPRSRARRTAEIAGFAHAEVDEDLVEWDYGEYEGLTTKTIRQSDRQWSVWTGHTPGGETAAQVGERIDRVIDRVRAGGRTLVFAHGHSLRVLAARWLGLRVDQGSIFVLGTGTYSILGEDRGTRVVRQWNVAAA